MLLTASLISMTCGKSRAPMVPQKKTQKKIEGGEENLSSRKSKRNGKNESSKRFRKKVSCLFTFWMLACLRIKVCIPRFHISFRVLQSFRVNPSINHPLKPKLGMAISTYLFVIFQIQEDNPRAPSPLLNPLLYILDRQVLQLHFPLN